METEIWKSIIGHEHYAVSTNGRIKNSKGVILRPTPHRNGYLMISLCSHNTTKKCTIHRLVALAFIDNPLCKPDVNHIDGNKKHNFVSNIEWCTKSENMQHAWDNGLIPKQEFTAERRQMLRVSCSERFKGIKQTEEHKAKTKKSNENIYHGNKNRVDFIHVKCVETNEEFLSIKYAAVRFGFDRNKLWQHIRNGRKMDTNGYTFEITRNNNKDLRVG